MPYVPLPEGGGLIGNRCFLGESRAKSIGSADDAMAVVTVGSGLIGCSGSPSAGRLHGPEADNAMGDGSGVISTSGPTPGDEIAEPGESELTLDRDCAGDSAGLTLELRTGRPAFSMMFEGVSSTTGNGTFELSSFLESLDGRTPVFSRSPAL